MTLKDTEIQIKNIKSKIKNAENAVLQHQSSIDKLKIELASKIKEAEKERLKATLSPIIVTDHAMVRYIERKTGIDIEELKNELITDALKNLVGKYSDGTFKSKGTTYVIKNRAIVTII